MNAGQHFGHCSIVVNPTLGRCGFEHGIFTAHIVRRYGPVHVNSKVSDHIQVTQRRFHHQKVSPFIRIQFRLSQCFVAISGIHLIGFLIPGLGGTFECIPKRTVKRTRVFGTVGYNSRLGEIRLVQGFPNNPYDGHTLNEQLEQLGLGGFTRAGM